MLYIKLQDLMPTHNNLRSPQSIPYFRQLAKSGLVSGIKLFECGDNRIYIHDGHHRLVGKWLEGRWTLKPHEYTLFSCSYEYYMWFNFEAGWVTPFDPRIEVRVPNFFSYKDKVIDIFKKSGTTAAIQYSDYSRSNYVCDRMAISIIDLVLGLYNQ